MQRKTVKKMDEKQLLFALVRYVICDAQPQMQLLENCTPELLASVATLAERHDLAHLVGTGMSKLSLPDCEARKKCSQAVMLAVYRHTQQDYEYKNICAALEAGQIPFIPLKGSVLRNYYPESWMRTSCDIDILVHPQDLDRAVALLAEKLHYKVGEKWGHDISLFSPGGVHLELHYAVIEDTQVQGSQRVLDDFWTHAVPVEGFTYWHCVTDEMFYFYHIAHMAKHVQFGGCGIRPFLDLWILEHRIPHDSQKRLALLEKGGLKQFAAAAVMAAEHWFSDIPCTEPLADFFEKYIFSGGVYGTVQNIVSVRRTEKSGSEYAVSRIFVDRKSLAFMFPVLNKYPWLAPVFQVVRWFKLLFGGKMGRAAREFWMNANVSKEQTASVKDMLNYLGLNSSERGTEGP